MRVSGVTPRQRGGVRGRLTPLNTAGATSDTRHRQPCAWPYQARNTARARASATQRRCGWGPCAWRGGRECPASQAKRQVSGRRRNDACAHATCGSPCRRSAGMSPPPHWPQLRRYRDADRRDARPCGAASRHGRYAAQGTSRQQRVCGAAGPTGAWWRCSALHVLFLNALCSHALHCAAALLVYP